VVVDAVEGMIAFLLVNSVARLPIDFEDVRDDPSFGRLGLPLDSRSPVGLLSSLDVSFAVVPEASADVSFDCSAVTLGVAAVHIAHQ